MAEFHHVIPQQRIKIARSRVAIKIKTLGASELTDAEHRLFTTPLQTILDDRRNQVRLKRSLHHRAHHGANPYRLKPDQLPRGIEDFAAEYALEAALDHELRLLTATPMTNQEAK
jgi:hypothetical protein